MTELPPGIDGNIALQVAELGFQIYEWVSTFSTWEAFLRSWFDTPFGNFLDLFWPTGKAKVGPDSDTEAIARYLRVSVNPIVQWYGIAIRGMEARGIPISIQGGFPRLAKAFTDDLVRQWGQTQGEDWARKWFTAIQHVGSDLAIQIRANHATAYRDAIQTGRINPATGWPRMGSTYCPKAILLCPGCCDAITGQCKQTPGCLKCVSEACNGGNNMACQTTHNVTSRSQGPGPCCAALAASGQTPHVGLRLAAKDRSGRCIVCEVIPSRSKKAAPGQLAFKRGRAAGLCPTRESGCCALNSTLQQQTLSQLYPGGLSSIPAGGVLYQG